MARARFASLVEHKQIPESFVDISAKDAFTGTEMPSCRSSSLTFGSSCFSALGFFAFETVIHPSLFCCHAAGLSRQRPFVLVAAAGPGLGSADDDVAAFEIV